ncbi:hypothetical protein B0T09DRAFT_55282 [Sordaria sp. MPI-SDFR-AT-0083]|nr:hypothetical protein B0T09DRAFT_55282 [Sordaria sp. MPI-SDFR-AT-0083]
MKRTACTGQQQQLLLLLFASKSMDGRDGGWDGIKKVENGSPPNGSPRLQLAMCTAFGPKNGAPPTPVANRTLPILPRFVLLWSPVVPTPDFRLPSIDQSLDSNSTALKTRNQPPEYVEPSRTATREDAAPGRARELLSISFSRRQEVPPIRSHHRKTGVPPFRLPLAACERAPRWTFELQRKLGPHSTPGRLERGSSQRTTGLRHHR